MDPSRFHNQTITARSPLVKYSPAGSWINGGVVADRSGKASLSFFGTGILVMGDGARGDYTVSIDGTEQPDYTTRRYAPEDPDPEGYPSYCDFAVPNECVLLGDFSGLKSGVEHVVEFQAKGSFKILFIKVMQDTGNPRFIPSDFQVDRTRSGDPSSSLVFEGSWEDDTQGTFSVKTSRNSGDFMTFKQKFYSVILYGSTFDGEPSLDINLNGETTTLGPSGANNTGFLRNVLFMRAGLNQSNEQTLIITNRGENPFIFASLEGIAEIPGLSELSDFETTSQSPEQTPGNPDTPNPANNALSPGIIAGAVVGAILGLAMLSLLVWWILTRKRRSKKAPDEANPQAEPFLTAPFPAPVTTFSGSKTAPFQLGPTSDVITPSPSYPRSKGQDQAPPRPTTVSLSPSTTDSRTQTVLTSQTQQSPSSVEPPSDSQPPLPTDDQINQILEILAHRMGAHPEGDNPPSYHQ